MKGLLIKDYYMALKYAKGYFLISIIFGIISIMGSDNMFFALYPAMLGGLFSVSIMAYDEKSGWNSYAAILPCTRRMIVTEKYIFAVLFIIPIAVINSAAIIAGEVMRGGSIAEAGMIILTMLSVAIIFPSIMLPSSLKFGVEKGRIIFYIVIVLISASFPVIFNIIGSDGDMSPVVLPYGFQTFIIAVVIMVLSWFVSVRIYEGKDI